MMKTITSQIINTLKILLYHSFDDLQAFQDIIKIIEKDLSPEMMKTQLKLIDEENVSNKKK